MCSFWREVEKMLLLSFDSVLQPPVIKQQTESGKNMTRCIRWCARDCVHIGKDDTPLPWKRPSAICSNSILEVGGAGGWGICRIFPLRVSVIDRAHPSLPRAVL